MAVLRSCIPPWSIDLDIKCCGWYLLEVDSKPHLRSNGCVAPRIEILTYLRVRSVFNSRDALPLNLIWGFETTSKDSDYAGFDLYLFMQKADAPKGR